MLHPNLRNTLHVGDKACKLGIHPNFETHQKSKTRAPVTPQKDLCPKIVFNKETKKLESLNYEIGHN